jgi:hypothetical protein
MDKTTRNNVGRSSLGCELDLPTISNCTVINHYFDGAINRFLSCKEVEGEDLSGFHLPVLRSDARGPEIDNLLKLGGALSGGAFGSLNGSGPLITIKRGNPMKSTTSKTYPVLNWRPIESFSAEEREQIETYMASPLSGMGAFIPWEEVLRNSADHVVVICTPSVGCDPGQGQRYIHFVWRGDFIAGDRMSIDSSNRDLIASIAVHRSKGLKRWKDVKVDVPKTVKFFEIPFFNGWTECVLQYANASVSTLNRLGADAKILPVTLLNIDDRTA